MNSFFRMMARCEKSMLLDSHTWDGRAVRPAELSQAQAHGQSEAGQGWTKWGGDGVRDMHRRERDRERERERERERDASRSPVTGSSCRCAPRCSAAFATPATVPSRYPVRPVRYGRYVRYAPLSALGNRMQACLRQQWEHQGAPMDSSFKHGNRLHWSGQLSQLPIGKD